MAATEGITIRENTEPGAIIVAPESDVDMSRSPALRTALRGALERKPPRLVIDLAGVGYMDSSGLATLVEAMRTAKTSSTPMVLCGMNEKVRAIFEIARLHQFFKIVDNVDAALDS